MIKIVLKGAPRGKGRPRITRAGAFTPEKTRRYEGLLKSAAMFELDGRPPLEGPLHVDIRAYMPIPKSWPKYKKKAAAGDQMYHTSKPDFDNISKMVDALNGIAWRDDAQVASSTFYKVYSDEPRLELDIYQLEEAA